VSELRPVRAVDRPYNNSKCKAPMVHRRSPRMRSNLDYLSIWKQIDNLLVCARRLLPRCRTRTWRRSLHHDSSLLPRPRLVSLDLILLHIITTRHHPITLCRRFRPLVYLHHHLSILLLYPIKAVLTSPSIISLTARCRPLPTT
jgi:hypothetical protein